MINSKLERAKSRVVEEIKSVLEFENKIVVVSSYGLTPCCSGRDNGGINFKHRAGNVPPLNNGVRFGDRQKFVHKIKYRGATKNMAYR